MLLAQFSENLFVARINLQRVLYQNNWTVDRINSITGDVKTCSDKSNANTPIDTYSPVSRSLVSDLSAPHSNSAMKTEVPRVKAKQATTAMSPSPWNAQHSTLLEVMLVFRESTACILLSICSRVFTSSFAFFS